MNIAVINIKDLFKYILKFFIVIFVIMILSNLIRSFVTIKETIKSNSNKIERNSFINCLELTSSLFTYKNIKKEKKDFLIYTKILSMQTGVFNLNILKNIDSNKEEIKIEEEPINVIDDIPKEVQIENVEENNIIPNVTNIYNGVKIDNQSDYEITEDMLLPDSELTNKKDVLIYHTHTCESYTSSVRIRI